MKGSLRAGYPMRIVTSEPWNFYNIAGAMAPRRAPAGADPIYGQPWRAKIKVRGPSKREPQPTRLQMAGLPAGREEGRQHRTGGKPREDVLRRSMTFAVASILIALGGIVYAHYAELFEPAGSAAAAPAPEGSGRATGMPDSEAPVYRTGTPVTERLPGSGNARGH